MWGSTSNSQNSKPWKSTNQPTGSAAGATPALLGAHHRFHQEHVPRQIPEDAILEEVGNAMPYTTTTASAPTDQANVHEDVVPLPPSSTMQSSENGELPRTLWMGDLDPSFNERTIELLWGSLGKRVRVKLIRAKKNLLIPCSTASTHAEEQHTQVGSLNQEMSTFTPNLSTNTVSPKTASASININGTNFIDPNTTQLHHAGYCFVEFDTFKDAQHALTMNSKPIPNVYDEHIHRCTNSDFKRTFRLNWASGATLQSIIPATPEYSLFVGDLAPDCYEQDLLSLFQTKYASVKTVRVMTDPITGASRCFGFVRFQDFLERELAVLEMNGVWCKGRLLRVAYATPRSSSSSTSGPSSGPSNSRPRSFSDNARHQKHDWSVHEAILASTASPPTSSYPLSPRSSVSGGLKSALFDRRSSEGVATTSSGLSPPKNNSNANNVSNIVTISQMPLGTSKTASGPNDSIQRRASTGSSFFAHGIANTNMNTNTNTNTNTSTTVFIGGLNNKIDEFQLYSMFQPFGKIVQVKIPHNKGCGFVKFGQRRDAEAAIVGLQGFILKSTGLPIRLSWGRETNASTGTGGMFGSFDGSVATGYQQQQQQQQQQQHLSLQPPITSPVGNTSEFGFPATEDYASAQSGPQLYQQDVFGTPLSSPGYSRAKRSSSLSYPMSLSQSLNMQDYTSQSGFGNGTFSGELRTAFPQTGLQPNLYSGLQALQMPHQEQQNQQQQQQQMPISPGALGLSAFDQNQQNITSSNLSQFPAFTDPSSGMKRNSIDHHEWK
ncbi:hypothetical protein ACO0QE_003679 [Hanseniaspora vineae]